MKESKRFLTLAVVLVALALVLVLAACGEKEESTTTTAAPSTTQTTGAPSSETTVPASTETTTAGPVETLKVGAVMQLTDWYSAVDASEKGDTEIVAQMINEQGGVLADGKRYNVQVVIQDGKSSVDGNTAAANKLALDEGVKFAIGPSAFFNAATSPIFEQNKILHVAGYNTLMPGELDSTTPYGFLGSCNPVGQQNMNLKALKLCYPNVKNIVLGLTEEASTPYLLPHLQKLAADMGFNLLDTVKWPNNLEDYSSMSAKFNSYKDADAYWFAIGHQFIYSPIVKGLRTLGNTKPVVFTGYAPMYVELIGKDGATNVVVPGVVPSDPQGTPPLIQEVYKRGDPSRIWYGLIPNALYMLCQVINKAGTLDVDKVKETWESMEVIPSLYGDAITCGTELYGLPRHAIVYEFPVYLIENAQWSFKGKVMPDPTP
ncbi:MAG: ABC transporter substrate-binding protein [Thermoleophilia bacterium]|nr:ABC transporter substrate-binding protein [Thermoleophilia bacterium]